MSDEQTRIETLESIAACFEFALAAIVAADESEHDIHDNCDGLVARTALETATKIARGYVKSRQRAQQPATAAEDDR